MNYLLDTSTFLWALFSPEKLSSTVKELILDNRNTLYVSAVTFWEISLKYSLKKLELHTIKPQELIHAAKKSGFQTLPLPSFTASRFHLLPRLHKDPFDRMLVWQAMEKNYILVSKDRELKNYRKLGLQVVW